MDGRQCKFHNLLSIENLSVCLLWCCYKFLYLSSILVIFKVTWFRLFLLSFTAVIFTIIVTFWSTKRVFTAAISVKLSTIFVAGVFIVIWLSTFTASTILIASTISAESTATISTPFTPCTATTFNFNVYRVSVNNNALKNFILKILSQLF